MKRVKCNFCDKYFTAETEEQKWCPRCTEEYEAVSEKMSATRCKFHACTSPMACEAQGKCLRQLKLVTV